MGIRCCNWLILTAIFVIAMGPLVSHHVYDDDGSAPNVDESWHLKENRFVQSSVCRSCFHSVATNESRCGQEIYRVFSQSKSSLAYAAAFVAKNNPACSMCDPQSCSIDEKRYWMFDKAAPAIVETNVISMQSIPHRLPSEAVVNISAWVSVDPPRRTYPLRQYWFDYNPSIVPLPPAYFPLFSDTASYLVSFRVSNQHYCMRPIDRKLLNGEIGLSGEETGRHPPETRDYLGLAVMNDNFTILAEAVVDLKAAGFQQAEDFRLFRLGDYVYVSSYDLVAPIFLSNTEKHDHIELKAIFTSKGFDSAYIGRNIACAPCERTRACGKNINYFASAGKTFAEIWPSPPHLVRGIDLTVPCDRVQKPLTHVDESPPHNMSFATTEELDFPMLSVHEKVLTRGRGGSCCIEMHHPASPQTLLVGVSHSKTPSQGRTVQNVTSNHYLSHFYAFEKEPPFRLIARSGYFCFGFPTLGISPVVKLTRFRSLRIGRSFSNCPRIHFVSGITTKRVESTDHVVLTMGINDCFSSLVTITFSEVSRLLFG